MNKSALPEIRISYAWLLARESRIISESIKFPLMSDEDAVAKVDAYRNEWQKYSEDILAIMMRTLGLSFYKNVIDVHIAQFFIPSSEPLLISLMDDPDQFVDTLTHELIHVLLTDNNIFQMNGKDRSFKLADEWEKLFGKNHSFTTLVHIPVHAVHKKILLEFFKDQSRVTRDVELLKRFNSEDYLKSWEYVGKNDYDKIIDQLKGLYRQIAENTKEKA